MCRLLAYMGPPVLMADVVLWPDRSIIKQSYDARERRVDAGLPAHLAHGNLNGDGFGIGWFAAERERGRDPTPCVFTSVTPAWNNENLGRLARKIASPLVFAHVRAAMPGMAVNEQNCHPFAHGRYLWMHNGVVGGFMAVRRALVAGLSDAAYDAVQSFHSDSAVAFAVFLHHLPDLESHHPPVVLLGALQATLATIAAAQAGAGVREPSLLNFCVADGDTLLATRYVTAPDNPSEEPASLYYAEGANFHRRATAGGGGAPRASCAGDGAASADAPGDGDGPSAPSPSTAAAAAASVGGLATKTSSIAHEGEYTLSYAEAGSRTALIASEPITRSGGDWVSVPRNTAVVMSREKGAFVNIMLAPLGPGACGAAVGTATREEDVAACLEAITGAAEVSARPFRADGGGGGGGGGANGEAGGNGHAHRHNHLPHGRSQPRRRSWSTLSDGAGADGLGETPRARGGQGASGHHLGGTGAPPTHTLAQTQDHRMTGHGGAVLCLTQVDDLAFSGSVDRTVKVWDLAAFTCVRTLAGHAAPVQRLWVSGGHLYSAGGRTVRVTDLATWACVRVLTLPATSGSIFALAVGGGGTVYVAGQDTAVRAFAPGGGGGEHGGGGNVAAAGCAPARALASPSAITPPDCGHCSAVCSLALVGGYVCSAGGDATIRVWVEGSLAPAGILRGHRGSVLSLYALNGALLSGGRDNIIRVWDVEACLCRHTLVGHQDDVLALSGIAPTGTGQPGAWGGGGGGSTFASPGAVAAVGAPADGGGGMGGRRESLASLSPAALFASASADGTVRVWTAEGWACLRVLAASLPTEPPGAHPYTAGLPYLCVEQRPDLVIAGAADGQLRIWEVDAGPGYSSGWDRGGAPAALVSSPRPPPSKRARGGLLPPPTTSAAAAAAASAGPSPVGPLAVKPAVPACLDADLERALRDFVRLRTVSADPTAREACFRGAKFLAGLLEGMGAEIKLVRDPTNEARNPVVLGRIGRNPAAPTVTFYGHYDVQPAMEREWMTDPFSLTSVDGYLYGRGTSDNKGPILAFLFAVKEMLADNAAGCVVAAAAATAAGGAAVATAGAGAAPPTKTTGTTPAAANAPDVSPCTANGGGAATPLPPGPGINVAFVFEGEEENGSGGFREAVAANAHWFAGTSLIVISNTLWVGESVPCLTYGMRGMIAASIEVRGPPKDLHSGNDGGVLAEPLADLAKVLASLVGPGDGGGRVSVPGFYEGVRPGMLEPALARLAGSAEFSVGAYAAALGLPPAATAGLTAADVLRARWCEPTLSVCDVRVGDDAAAAGGGGGGGGGPGACGHEAEDGGGGGGGGGEDPHYRFGPTRFSVIPRTAVGNVSIRYVPDQDPTVLIGALRDHVAKVFAGLKSPNSCCVRVRSVGDWWEADPGAPYFQLAEKVLASEWGVHPLFVREGGTMPVASALEQLLGAPALLLPFGQASDGCHLANERLKRANLMHGKNVIRGLLQELACAAMAGGGDGGEK